MDTTDLAVSAAIFCGEILLMLTVTGVLTAVLTIAALRAVDALLERRAARAAAKADVPESIPTPTHHCRRDLPFTMAIPATTAGAEAIEEQWRRRERQAATWPSDAGAPE